MEVGFGELLLAAFGLYLLIEGAALALFPEGVQRIMALALQLPPPTLRAIGLGAFAAGAAVVWIAHL